MDFHLRDFRPEDFETLWSVDQQCFPPGIAYSRRELAIYIRERGAFTLVAAANAGTKPGKSQNHGEIVGFIVAEARRGTGHIITIDVVPTMQRSGLGSKLLMAAEERLEAVHCRSIYLETAVDNRSALSFYKRHRYFLSKVVPGYYSNGVDALVLQKDLLSAAQAS